MSNLFSKYLNFFSSHYRYFIFTSLFYSIWLISHIYIYEDLELRSFPGRMIGQATISGIDISARIFLFYKCGGIFILFNFLCSIIALLLSKHKNISLFSELKIVNYTSLAGIILYFFQLFGTPVNDDLELIYCLQKIALVLIAVKILLKDNQLNKLFDTTFFSLIIIISFSVFFFIKELTILFDLAFKIDLYYSLFFSSLLFYGAVYYFLVQKLDYNVSKRYFNIFFYILIPITLIPLLSFAKDEFYLILNRREIYFFTPKKLYIIFLFLSFLWIILKTNRFRKYPDTICKYSLFELLAKFYFPLFILGIITFLYYQPFVDSSNEMFEFGNRFLPIMEFHNYGTIPIIEKLNAHLLSEIFFGLIYTGVNGLNGQEFLIYDFFGPVITALVSYFFLYKFTGNPYSAVFFVLFFPLSQIIIFEYLAISMLAIFILSKLIESAPSVKNYLLFLSSAVFFIVFRIDVGYPVLCGYVLVLVAYYLNQQNLYFNAKIFLKTLWYFTSIILLLFIYLIFIKGINVFEKARMAFNYFAASQTYGHSVLGNSALPEFKMQYFVFPLIVLSVGGYIALKFKQICLSRHQRYITISLLFLVVFYIFNFQRGLMRHSFIEGEDTFLSSFAFLIFGGSTYLFLYKKSHITKFIIFIAVSSFIVLNYKFPKVEQVDSTFQQIKNKMDIFPKIVPKKEKISRSTNSEKVEKEYKDFKKFIDENLGENETFIDFSNTPMLYYYTQKITPSSAYHNPLTIHNDYLQNNFMDGLKNYSTPFVVFSGFPETWYDNVDGVPNTVRHYKIVEYLYREYEPYAIIQRYCIWKKKSTSIHNEEKILFEYDTTMIEKISEKTCFTRAIEINKNKKYFFKVKFYSEQYQEVGLGYLNPSDSTLAKETSVIPACIDEHNNIAYFIPDVSNIEKVVFHVKNLNNIIGMQLIECNYIPDFYSTIPKSYNINKLPYIWANYDVKIKSANTLEKLMNNKEILKFGAKIKYKIPKEFDKSSGNYIVLKINSNSDSPFDIKLSYGNGSNRNGEYIFSIVPGDSSKTYAIRVSSQYNWFTSDNDFITIEANSGKDIITELNELNILKGD